jgi:hypothetical protein
LDSGSVAGMTFRVVAVRWGNLSIFHSPEFVVHRMPYTA